MLWFGGVEAEFGRALRDWGRGLQRILPASAARSARWSRRRSMGTTRPTPGRELWVFEDDGVRLRLARVRREGARGVRLLSLEVVPEGGERRARLDELRERCRGESSSTILVTHRARPLLDFVSPTERRDLRGIIEERLGRELDHQREQRGGGELACGWTAELALEADEDCRVTATAVGAEVRELWVDRLARPGLVLEGIYPLIGTPIAALDEEDAEGPLLALQVEEQAVAVLEVAGGSPRSIEIHEPVRPTARLCGELVGTACPEVLLGGGRPDLAQLGYEIARTSGTWVRILKPGRFLSADGHRSENLAAILGAANHAFGLAHGSAVACVPPRG